MKESPLYTFTSHIKGGNAKVSIYPDRIDWIKPRGVSGGKATAGVLTYGLSLLATGVRKKSNSGAEMIPVKSISSVVTSREGIRYDKVSVITTGNTVDFRVSHSDAAKVKEILNQLIRGAHPAQQSGQSRPVSQVPPSSSQGDVMEQLAKLGELKAAGILTEEEFQSKKTELLRRL